MKTYRKSTIKDVAARARVSVTTVSHVVSGRAGACSLETAARVQDAITALHYRPSLVTPVQRSTRTLGVYLNLGFEQGGDQRGTYLERLWRGISREAGRNNYCLLYYPDDIRQHVEDFCVFLDGRVDGVMLVPATRGDTRLASIAASGIPIVVISQSEGIPAGCAAAYCDERQTVDLALSHLWELGHRRIAHIAGPVQTRSYDSVVVAVQRRDHYVGWLTIRSAYDPSLLAVADTWETTDLSEIVQTWKALPEPPTAVFCANDAIAACLIAAAQAAGWRIPQDLSIVGVDNTAASAETTPPLTTVDIPMERVGEAAVLALLQLMDGDPADLCRTSLPVTELIVRGSTQAFAASFPKGNTL